MPTAAQPVSHCMGMPPNGDRCTNTEHVSYLYRCIKQLPIAKIIKNRATFLQIYSEILTFVIFNLCMLINLIFKVKNIKCKESTRFWERGTRSTEPHRKYKTWYNSTRFGNPVHVRHMKCLQYRRFIRDHNFMTN